MAGQPIYEEPNPFEPPVMEVPSSFQIPVRYDIKPPSVEDRLQSKIDSASAEFKKDRAEREAAKARQKRSVDSQTMSIILQDQKEALAHQQALQQRVDALMGQMGQAMAPQMQPGRMSLGQLAAQGLGALMTGGRSVNQGYGLFQGQADDRAKMDYQNQSAQFELDQNAKMRLLQYLMGQENQSGDMVRMLEGERINTLQADDAFSRSMEQERLQQDALTARSREAITGRETLEELKQKGRLDKEKIGIYKAALAKSPASARDDILKEAIRATGGNVAPELLAAIQELNADELLKGAKTNETNKMLPGKLAQQEARTEKIKVDVQRELGVMKLDDAKRRQIEQKMQYVPLEFAVRKANAEARLAGRAEGKALTGPERQAMKDVQSIANATIKGIEKRLGHRPILGVDPVEDVYAYAQAMEDLGEANKSLTSAGKAVAAKVGGRRPAPMKGSLTPPKVKGNPGWKVEIE